MSGITFRFAGGRFEGYAGYRSLMLCIVKRHTASTKDFIVCASRYERYYDADVSGYTEVVLAHSRLSYECRNALAMLIRDSSTAVNTHQ